MQNGQSHQTMKEISEQEAWLRLSTLCANSEHCQQEITEKMQRWGISNDAQVRIMERLKKERYVDDERFARAFVGDKVRFDKWGRRKIEQALWMKHISDDIQQRVLNEVDAQLYVDNLRTLLKTKRKSTKAQNDYELRQKLIRFAMGRGYDFDIIRQAMEEEEEE